MSWQADKRWSDRFIPEIKLFLADVLISEAPLEEDMYNGTDLVVLRMESIRIGCRIRNHTYLNGFGNQFTIRNDRPSGNKTEMRKIIEGWGDYFFYGFSDPSEKALSKGTLIDLKVFRGNYAEQHYRLGREPGLLKKNYDGSSSFLVFNIKDFPEEMIVKQFIKTEYESEAMFETELVAMPF